VNRGGDGIEGGFGRSGGFALTDPAEQGEGDGEEETGGSCQMEPEGGAVVGLEVEVVGSAVEGDERDEGEDEGDEGDEGGQELRGSQKRRSVNGRRRAASPRELTVKMKGRKPPRRRMIPKIKAKKAKLASPAAIGVRMRDPVSPLDEGMRG